MTLPAATFRGGPFSELVRSRGAAALRKPPRVVELPLSAWADGREDKPSAPMPIGLRRPSEEDVQRARDEAGKAMAAFAANGDDDDRVAAYNDGLIRALLEAVTCQSADVTKPFFEAGALEIAARLTTAGVQRLWQELGVLQAEADPAMPEIDDEGFAHLIITFERGIAFNHMPTEEGKRLKRLLEHVRIALAEGEERAARAGVAIVEG